MEYVYIQKSCMTSLSIIHFIHLLTGACKWKDQVEEIIIIKKDYQNV